MAAIQPTVYQYRSDGKTAYSSLGMLRITVNQQQVDNQAYLQPASFDTLQGRNGESQQRVWNAMVDLDKGIVTDIFETSDRLIDKIPANKHDIHRNEHVLAKHSQNRYWNHLEVDKHL